VVTIFVFIVMGAALFAGKVHPHYVAKAALFPGMVCP
jgi:hypothetical protein